MRIREIGIIVAIVVGVSFGAYEIGKEIIKPIPNAIAQSAEIARASGVVTYLATGYQSLTPNSTTASSLTVPTSAEVAFITAETANMRFRLDGTAPTTSEGHLLTSGTVLFLPVRSQLIGFKVISASTHGVLKISYGK